jgi:hypothetical protein
VPGVFYHGADMITGQDLNGVQGEAVRRYKDLDLIFVNQVLDPLNDAYYNNWKLGSRQAWFGFNIHPKDTPEEAKLLFEQLHTLCWAVYEVVYKLLADEVGEAVYFDGLVDDPDYDEDVDPVRPDPINKIELAKRTLRRIRDVQNLTLDQVKNFVENRFGIIFDVGD